MKIKILSLANWNVEPIIESLLKLNHDISLFSFMRTNIKRGNNLNIFRPKFSVLMQILNRLLGLLNINNSNLFGSKYKLLQFIIYDIECCLHILVKRDIDVVIGWASCCTFSFLLCKAFKIQTILFMGNSHIDTLLDVNQKIAKLDHLELFKTKQKSEYQSASLILVESEYSKKTLIRNSIPINKISVLNIPPSKKRIDRIEELNSKLQIKEKSFIDIAFVSPREIKGFSILKSVIKNFEKNNNFKFNIFGLEKKQFKEFEKFDNVVCNLFKTSNYFLDDLNKCDVLFLPTFEDGGPRVLNEALLLGLYCIGSSFSKLPEFEIFELCKVVSSNKKSDYLNELQNLNPKYIFESRNCRIKKAKSFFLKNKLDDQLKKILRKKNNGNFRKIIS